MLPAPAALHHACDGWARTQNQETVETVVNTVERRATVRWRSLGFKPQRHLLAGGLEHTVRESIGGARSGAQLRETAGASLTEVLRRWGSNRGLGLGWS